MQSRKKRAKMQIKLNSRFYRKEVVEEALDNFKELCESRMSYDSAGSCFIIEMKAKGNAACLEDEFCNYCLGLMKNKGLD
jgi:hypothetical protein